MSRYKKLQLEFLAYPSGAFFGLVGPDGVEYAIPVAPTLPSGSGTAGVTGNMTSIYIRAGGAGAGTGLTNPLTQCVGQFDNYTQNGIQNLSATANASADHIAYPDNISNDGTGFVDIGITSSTYAQAAYSVTGPNEPYVFGSSPSGAAGMTGDLVFATDSNGTSNGMRFYTNGFAQAIGNWAMKLTGSGLLQTAKGVANLAKAFVNNGATTSYTFPAATSYVYLTTTAVSLAVTLPAAAAAIDGLLMTLVPSATVGTATWLSTGATFVGAPAAFTANTPVRMIYDHASLKWYPA